MASDTTVSTERPAGHSGILGMAADRLRIRRVVGEQGERLAEAARRRAPRGRQARPRAGQPRGGLFRLACRQRVVEEVIGVGEKAVARLDARDAGG